MADVPYEALLDRLASGGLSTMILAFIAFMLWQELKVARAALLDMANRSVAAMERSAAAQDAMVDAVRSNTETGANLRMSVEKLSASIDKR